MVCSRLRKCATLLREETHIKIVNTIKMEEKTKNEGVQSRREFFKSAAKKALPILSAITLVSSPIMSKAAEVMSCGYGCTYGCGVGCGRSCSNNCSGGCKGGCGGACSYSCQNTCKGSCQSSCKGWCSRTNGF